MVCQIFYNSIYYGALEEDEMLLPKEGSDNRYHIEGNLCIVKKSALKDLAKLLVIKW